MRAIGHVKKVFLYLTVLFFSVNSFAQIDSTVFSYNEYIENIIKFHPLAQKTNITLDLGKLKIKEARGGLDPRLEADWSQKNLKDKLYYKKYQAKLRIPTPFGVEVVGGYENTEGKFLNAENTTDEFGLWNVGVEVNLLQGLLMNKRRMALQQARIFEQKSINVQKIALNQLVYDASVAYMEWQKAYYSNVTLLENITRSNTYFEGTKVAFLNGEKTAMDTLEASMIYQEAVVLHQKNNLKLIEAKQKVENYLWFNDLPVQIRESQKPQRFQDSFYQNIVAPNNEQLATHPMIQQYANKLSYYEIFQRMKREKLKPKLKVKYNPLLITSKTDISPQNFSVNNYKWGFEFSMPLLLRKERAGVKQGKLKLQSIELSLKNKTNELQNKAESSWQQQELLNKQLAIISGNVVSYRKLLEGEEEKFKYGESSVFLLNKRQEKYINSQLKEIDAYIKQRKTRLKFLFYSNQLIKNEY